MLEKLKRAVWIANMELPRRNLVTFTWGNVSGKDGASGLIVIKPSGVEYEKLKAKDLVVLDLEGNVVEGTFRPSSDTATHIELYRAFPEIGGIVHTHSPWATGWAQAGRPIPCYGTTQADYFYGDIPCTRGLTPAEVESDYEKNTGLVIVEALRKADPFQIPGILCLNHGPFSWGKDAAEAVHNAAVMEECAKIAGFTEMVAVEPKAAPKHLVDKHFFRKHGKNAYYGQK